jgi:mRNA interferase HicA
MKRVDLIRTIEGFGCVLVRHGGKHDWYRNPVTGISQPVPRHREIAVNPSQSLGIGRSFIKPAECR